MAIVAVPPTNRLFTCDLALFGVDSNLNYGSPSDLLGLYTECEVRGNKDMAEAYVPHDTLDVANGGFDGFFYQRSTFRHWEITLGKLVDGSVYGATLLLLALTAPVTTGSPLDIPVANNRGLVAVRMYRPGVGRGNTVNQFRGLAFFTEARFRLDGAEATTESGTLTGFGPLERWASGGKVTS